MHARPVASCLGFLVRQAGPVQKLASHWLCALQAIINGLHSRGQRFVPIVEPVVHVQQGYAVYDSGIKDDVFVKDVRGDNYMGQVTQCSTLVLESVAQLCSCSGKQ